MTKQWFAPDDYGTYRTSEECLALEEAHRKAMERKTDSDRHCPGCGAKPGQDHSRGCKLTDADMVLDD